MSLILAQSPTAAIAYELVQDLQHLLVDRLESLGHQLDLDTPFNPVEWLRDQGTHGGGLRYEIGDTLIFNRASVNISQVHYDDLPERKLASATALSSIIHPANPLAPSLHLHISWTEMKSGQGYWRIMADLNPSVPDDNLKQVFESALKQAAGAYWEEGQAQGERYFYIPAVERHRGVLHFYLEAFQTADPAADLALARRFGETVIVNYTHLLQPQIVQPSSPEQQAQQLAYHTLYFFQVLTLDRGTTSGLLIHNQNDVGILGSLPARIDKALLGSWQIRLAQPQDQLLAEMLAVLPDEQPCTITEPLKARLAQVVRSFYQRYPQALAQQATGNMVPPTVENHKG